MPPNGLVLYTGTIMTEDGKEKKVNIDFEPFKPINTSLYLCDNKFHTEALNELLEADNKCVPAGTARGSGGGGRGGIGTAPQQGAAATCLHALIWPDPECWSSYAADLPAAQLITVLEAAPPF